VFLVCFFLSFLPPISRDSDSRGFNPCRSPPWSPPRPGCRWSRRR
jgi:hypothetical protein